MTFYFIFTAVVIVVGIILYILIKLQHQSFGILKHERIYQDTEASPGKTLYAQSVPLVGRPDYILKENNQVTPVEVKRGKTPSYPYKSHIMQLMAYCLLIEENYNHAPAYGFIKYKDREFKVFYTPRYKKELLDLIKTITLHKIHPVELTCRHAEHNFKIN